MGDEWRDETTLDLPFRGIISPIEQFACFFLIK